jgi:formyltetrahydrofolate hydrolase
MPERHIKGGTHSKTEKGEQVLQHTQSQERVKNTGYVPHTHIEREDTHLEREKDMQLNTHTQNTQTTRILHKYMPRRGRTALVSRYTRMYINLTHSYIDEQTHVPLLHRRIY